MQDQNIKTDEKNTNPKPGVVGTETKSEPAKPVSDATKKVESAVSKAAQSDFVRKIVEKIKNSENILIALSRNPSVDEMAAAIGLAVFLDSIQKHATAIYSGQTPDALNFLQPDETFEKTTASLQDFIIALNKDKADHLRYKLDGDFVKVYITPYRTRITEEDLTFSQGDYNVDFVIALNVPSAGDLDEALTEHGRIMHDASAVDITTGVPGKFGEIEWSNPAASSVCEMVTELIFALQGSDKSLDKDVATALLTGIVASTERFSNSKTSSDTLSLASKLMSMGADQQLISANVVDNKVDKPENDYGPGIVAEAPVDRTNLMVGHAVEGSLEQEMTNAAQVMAQGANPAAESVVVQPVVPNVAATALPNTVVPAEQNAAVPGAMTPREMAVSEPVMQKTPQVGAMIQPPAPAQPEQPKDYAQMMAQALAENDAAQMSAGMVNNGMVGAPMMGQMQGVEQVPNQQAQPQPQGQVMMPGAEAMQAQANVNPAAQAAPAGVAGEPVPNTYATVLPPPPAPTAGADMMPPVLPQVQMPNGAGQ